MSTKVILPVQKLRGDVEVLGDKSISHRALLLSALCEEDNEIVNLSDCVDVKSTASCLRQLGIDISWNGAAVKIKGMGLNGLRKANEPLDAGNSGTTIRLLSGILAGQDFSSVITGDASLRRRPMKRIIEPLRKMGAKIEGVDDNFAPLKIAKSNLRAEYHQLQIASAQVKSSILLAGLYADGVTMVEEPAISRDHTERMLDYLGAEIIVKHKKVYLQGKMPLQSRKLFVPGDISSAAFFMAAAILLPESEIRIKNVGINPTRTGIIDVLEKMGINVRFSNFKILNNEEVADIIIASGKLRGAEISGEIIPRIIDEIPIISVMATQAEGETVIRNAAELRVKESDRIRAIALNLQNMGAKVKELPDGLIIPGKQKLNGGKIDSFGDHRIAMAFSIAGLIAENETEIMSADCVSISYPNFYADLEKLYA